MNNKYLIGTILFLLLSNIYFWLKVQEKNFIETSSSSTASSPMQIKCLAWTSYEASTKTWRWRPENLNEFFPTKEDAVTNCMAVFGNKTD
jgi:hypothetical protein